MVIVYLFLYVYQRVEEKTRAWVQKITSKPKIWILKLLGFRESFRVFFLNAAGW